MTTTINFDKNWNNKLDCNYFTTIRDISKLDKYMQLEHRNVTILLNNKFHCKAKIISVRTCPFDKLPVNIKLLDTGNVNYDDIFNKFITSKDVVIVMLENFK